MKDVPAGQRGAKFVAAVCFILPTGQHLTCRGECPGRVAFERLAGDYGFGYDPLFVPDGYTKTFAEMTTEEKNAVSHRARAVRKLAAYLHSTER